MVFDNSGVVVVESISQKNVLKHGLVFKAIVKKVKKESSFKKGDLVLVKSISQTNNRSTFKDFVSAVVLLNNKKEVGFRINLPLNLQVLLNSKDLAKKTSFFFL